MGGDWITEKALDKVIGNYGKLVERKPQSTEKKPSSKDKQTKEK